jgi:hypothetical protein
VIFNDPGFDDCDGPSPPDGIEPEVPGAEELDIKEANFIGSSAREIVPGRGSNGNIYRRSRQNNLHRHAAHYKFPEHPQFHFNLKTSKRRAESRMLVHSPVIRQSLYA